MFAKTIQISKKGEYFTKINKTTVGSLKQLVSLLQDNQSRLKQGLSKATQVLLCSVTDCRVGIHGDKQSSKVKEPRVTLSMRTEDGEIQEPSTLRSKSPTFWSSTLGATDMSSVLLVRNLRRLDVVYGGEVDRWICADVKLGVISIQISPNWGMQFLTSFLRKEVSSHRSLGLRACVALTWVDFINVLKY